MDTILPDSLATFPILSNIVLIWKRLVFGVLRLVLAQQRIPARMARSTELHPSRDAYSHSCGKEIVPSR